MSMYSAENFDFAPYINTNIWIFTKQNNGFDWYYINIFDVDDDFIYCLSISAEYVSFMELDHELRNDEAEIVEETLNLCDNRQSIFDNDLYGVDEFYRGYINVNPEEVYTTEELREMYETCNIYTDEDEE